MAAAAPATAGSTVRSRQQDEVGRFTAATVAPGEVTGWAMYVAGVAWALRAGGHAVPDVDVLVDSDIPIGAGLSSSAALGCAMARLLTDLAWTDLDRTELALLVHPGTPRGHGERPGPRRRSDSAVGPVPT